MCGPQLLSVSPCLLVLSQYIYMEKCGKCFNRLALVLCDTLRRVGDPSVWFGCSQSVPSLSHQDSSEHLVFSLLTGVSWVSLNLSISVSRRDRGNLLDVFRVLD